MRSTIIPAQITTVEDKIAGNLTGFQLFLVILPIFLDSGIYISFPPTLHLALYKVILGLFTILSFSTLAIRIKGDIIVHWLVLLIRYTSRPRYYIADKNDSFQRDMVYGTSTKKAEEKEIRIINPPHQKSRENKKSHNPIELSTAIHNHHSGVRFIFTKKGGMYVSFSEID